MQYTAVFVVKQERNTLPVTFASGYASVSHPESGGIAALTATPIKISQNAASCTAVILEMAVLPSDTLNIIPIKRQFPPSICISK